MGVKDEESINKRELEWVRERESVEGTPKKE
jgi:hypothetical protein